jgi:hypothetical protein
MLESNRFTNDLDNAYREIVSISETMDDTGFARKAFNDRIGLREVVAFHTYWFGKLSAGIERTNRGEEPKDEQVRWSEIENSEDVVASHAQGKTKEEIVFEFGQAYEDLKESLAGYNAEDAHQGNIDEVLNNGIALLNEHVGIMRNWQGTRTAQG